MKTAKVYLFSNGNTACFVDNEQHSIIQSKSWLTLQIEWLIENGIDVEKSEINLPDGKIAKLFKVEDGWNWSVK